MAGNRPWARILQAMGPGVITGASDNDPAGISTYSVAGATAGYSFLWLTLLCIPLMIAVQDMSARIGAVRREGLGKVIIETRGRAWLGVALAALVITNITTIGADLAGMSAGLELLTRISMRWFVMPSAVFILLVQVFWSYRVFSRYMKYLTLILFSYVLAGILARPDTAAVLKNSILPNLPTSLEGLSILVGLLGTTISPYLLFWQASEEIEEIQEEERTDPPEQTVSMKSEHWRLVDISVGMVYSNVISYFIILASAATLHKAGIRIETAAQAAQALRPIAGDAAFLLFAIGIIGSALISVPVLAGSTAYPMSEWIGCPEGLDKSIHVAKCFYGVIAASVLIGMVIAFLPINPIRVLFYSQVLMGMLTPIFILILLLVARDREIMGEENANGPFCNIFGWITFVIMALADIALIWTLVA